MDAYTPFPVEHLAEELGFHHTALPLIVLIGGLIGCGGGFLLQYWISAVDYPLNIGGRPLNSWPSFIPVTFELTILCAALFAVLGMLGLNGLPMPYHSLFNSPRFALASSRRHFRLKSLRRFSSGEGIATTSSARRAMTTSVQDKEWPSCAASVVVRRHFIWIGYAKRRSATFTM